MSGAGDLAKIFPGEICKPRTAPAGGGTCAGEAPSLGTPGLPDRRLAARAWRSSTIVHTDEDVLAHVITARASRFDCYGYLRLEHCYCLFFRRLIFPDQLRSNNFVDIFTANVDACEGTEAVPIGGSANRLPRGVPPRLWPGVSPVQGACPIVFYRLQSQL